MNPVPLLVALVVGLVAFEGWCLVDLARAERVRLLPREAWAILMLLTIPFGGVAYLLYGRDRGDRFRPL